MAARSNASKVLLIEPYYSGSHKELIDLIHEGLKETVGVKVHLATLPGKKWHWRARTSALYFSQIVPKDEYTCIFTSCVLPLHELLGLRPEMQSSKKIIYFHENQLVYPVRKSKDRDFQYGYNQILSCLVADQIWFNSEYNRNSFLSNIKSFFKLQPDFRPKDLKEQIQEKCFVKYFPIEFSKLANFSKTKENTSLDDNRPIRIVWPHRWEFDKNPDLLFRVLYKIVDSGISNFRLSILGENFTGNPPIFQEAKTRLNSFIDHFGFLPNKEDYFKVLSESDIVLSTSNHEFFGVAMMESVFLGCFPMCPNKLVYPELYPNENHLYKDEKDLFEKLRLKLKNFQKIHTHMDFSLYAWEKLKPHYLNEICQ